MNPIGFSTGALALGDFRTALKYLLRKPIKVIELSALRVHELPDLLRAVSSLDLRQFEYIALHAPSSMDPFEEPTITRLLAEFPRDWMIVLHPDTIHNPRLWESFGGRLALENMDRRKADGRTAAELFRWFKVLPEARFCFDLAHAQQWDTTMTEAYTLLEAFAEKIVQVHISQLDSASHHYPLSSSSLRAFSEVASFIPDRVPIIIESRIPEVGIDEEVEKVAELLGTTRIFSQQIPA
jgi:hypothetical protein